MSERILISGASSATMSNQQRILLQRGDKDKEGDGHRD